MLVWQVVRALILRLLPPRSPAADHRGHAHAPDGQVHWHENRQGHGHPQACGCGHRHGPTADEVARLEGWRDAAALISGIAIRPCTGAVMLLVIAWQTGLHALGIGAVLAMALGTGAITAMVALASVALRETSLTASGPAGTRLAIVAPALQVGAGGAVLALSLGLLAASLG